MSKKLKKIVSERCGRAREKAAKIKKWFVDIERIKEKGIPYFKKENIEFEIEELKMLLVEIQKESKARGEIWIDRQIDKFLELFKAE